MKIQYVSEDWVIIGWGNGLVLVQCQAITWTNDDLLSVGPTETNLSEIWIKMQSFSFKKINAFENAVCQMTTILLRHESDDIM